MGLTLERKAELDKLRTEMGITPASNFNQKVQDNKTRIGRISNISQGLPVPTQKSSSNGIFKNFMIGASKGMQSTVMGMTELGTKGLEQTAGRIGRGLAGKGFTTDTTTSKNIKEYKQEYLTPENTAQKVGFGSEQIAEYLLPMGASKVTTLLGKTIPKLLAKSIVGGVEFAGKTALQTGDTKKAAESGVIGAIAPPVISGGVKAVKKVLPGFGGILSSVMAQAIGKEPEHIIQAFKNPVVVAQNMAKKTIPLEVRQSAITALNSYKKRIAKDFKLGLGSLQKKVPSKLINKGKIEKMNIGKAKKMVQAAVNDSTKGLPGVFRKYNVSISKKGILDFDKLNSNIVSGAEKNAIQKAYNTINKQIDFTPQGVQRVASRLKALTKFSEGINTVSSAVVKSMRSSYSKAVKNSYPSLSKIRNDYRASMEIVNGVDEILNSVKNDIANPIKATSAVNKLSNIFKEDKEAYINAIKRLEQATGVDLLNQLAASEFKNITPGSFGSKAMQAGLVTGGAIFNPFLLTVLPFFSPRFVGKAVTTAGKVLPKVGEGLEKGLPLIPKVLTPLKK